MAKQVERQQPEGVPAPPASITVALALAPTASVIAVQAPALPASVIAVQAPAPPSASVIAAQAPAPASVTVAQAPTPPQLVTTRLPSLPLSPEVPEVASNPGFMADCHGEKWFENHAATMKDINGPYHYQSWSLKTPTDTTWIEGYNIDKKSRLDVFLMMFPPKAADLHSNIYQPRTGRS